MEMIERLCRAAAKAEEEADPDAIVFMDGDRAVRVWESYEPSVRAVLQTLREPSPHMIAAGISTRHEQEVPEAWNKATVHIWQAMIDAASK